jgi:hypothetical protein
MTEGVNLEELSLGDLKTLATGFGLKYANNIQEESLKLKIEDYIKANPGCLDDKDEGDNPPEQPKAPKGKVTGKVKIKSIHRGELSTSAGKVDLGTDGIAEVTEEQAKVLLSIKGFEKC